jgi:hypothetical protein
VTEHAVTLHLAVQDHFDEFTRLGVVFRNIRVEAGPLRRNLPNLDFVRRVGWRPPSGERGMVGIGGHGPCAA